jgi:hypothetical protein
MDTSNIVQGFHHLRKAQLNFEVVKNQTHTTLKESIEKVLIQRIEGIKDNFITSIKFDFPREVKDGINKEWQSDVLAVDNIYNLLHLLTPEKRELVETIVIALINGESINFEGNGTK